ncbi:hypothetical protein BpsM61_00073 [Bacillus phage vB_BpsM-61]|nr:hypothetical protein BpsM61_00073 [Bacillus phage vB_BpsM-61]
MKNLKVNIKEEQLIQDMRRNQVDPMEIERGGQGMFLKKYSAEELNGQSDNLSFIKFKDGSFAVGHVLVEKETERTYKLKTNGIDGMYHNKIITKDDIGRVNWNGVFILKGDEKEVTKEYYTKVIQSRIRKIEQMELQIAANEHILHRIPMIFKGGK